MVVWHIFSIALLGTFEVTLDGTSITGMLPAKGRALLAYLVVEAARPHQRDVLAELFWPDHSPQVARDSLRQALSTLRQVLGDRTAVLHVAPDHARDAPASTRPATICRSRRVRGVWSVPALLIRILISIGVRSACAASRRRPRFIAATSCSTSRWAIALAFEEWAALYRERLHGQMLDLLFHLANYHEQRGGYDLARQYAERQIDLDPWREEAYRQLMRSLAFSGQRSAALEVYERCRVRLEMGLSVEPAEETTALYGQIQAGTLPGSPLPRRRVRRGCRRN